MQGFAGERFCLEGDLVRNMTNTRSRSVKGTSLRGCDCGDSSDLNCRQKDTYVPAPRTSLGHAQSTHTYYTIPMRTRDERPSRHNSDTQLRYHITRFAEDTLLNPAALKITTSNIATVNIATVNITTFNHHTACIGLLMVRTILNCNNGFNSANSTNAVSTEMRNSKHAFSRLHRPDTSLAADDSLLGNRARANNHHDCHVW